MIQVGTKIKIVDNSGAKSGICIKVLKGYKRRYAYLGDVIIVSLHQLRSKRRDTLKVKKGQLYRALVLSVKVSTSFFMGDRSFAISDNTVFLLNKKNQIFGTRLFVPVSNKFRFLGYKKILTLGAGVVSF